MVIKQWVNAVFVYFVHLNSLKLRIVNKICIVWLLLFASVPVLLSEHVERQIAFETYIYMSTLRHLLSLCALGSR